MSKRRRHWQRIKTLGAPIYHSDRGELICYAGRAYDKPWKLLVPIPTTREMVTWDAYGSPEKAKRAARERTR
jgi:hypothetical protein